MSKRCALELEVFGVVSRFGSRYIYRLLVFLHDGFVGGSVSTLL